MTDKPLEMTLLFDFYGDLLTKKQRDLFDLYHNEDLSLTEIAENAGITRQAVRDGIVRAEHALREMEDRLGLVSRYGRIEHLAQELMLQTQALQALNDNRIHDPSLADIANRLSRIGRALQDGERA